MNEALFILIGVAVGAAIVLIVVSLRGRRESDLANAIKEQLKAEFPALSRDALSQNTDDFLKLAETRLERQTVEGEKSLDTKKKLIDARLEEMGAKLKDLSTLVQESKQQREKLHAGLSTRIGEATKATTRLYETTAQLSEALSSTQRRGQWGERMAEDVLRLAGFIEGVNYTKQKQLGEGSRPDFTFLLPGERTLNMDVKFPLDNYLKMLDAPDEATAGPFRKQFLRDVSSRVKEVTERDYIDPGAGTLDFVLVFIPNEQVYGFIHVQDATLLDRAMEKKVVLCSPLSLYAILSVIRQGMDNFRVEQNAKQILELLAGFKKEWGKYTESMDKMGSRLESAMKEYQELVGVRTRQLEKQINKIDDVSEARERQATLPPPAGGGSSPESISASTS